MTSTEKNFMWGDKQGLKTAEIKKKWRKLGFEAAPGLWKFLANSNKNIKLDGNVWITTRTSRLPNHIGNALLCELPKRSIPMDWQNSAVIFLKKRTVDRLLIFALKKITKEDNKTAAYHRDILHHLVFFKSSFRMKRYYTAKFQIFII